MLKDGKIGDEVVVVRPSSNYYKEVGNVTQCDKIGHRYFVRFDAKSGSNWFKPMELRLYKNKLEKQGVKKKMLKDGKIGDKVVIIDKESKYRGSIGIIIQNDGSNVPYKVETKNGDYNWFWEEDLKPYVISKKVKQPTITKKDNITVKQPVIPITAEKFKIVGSKQITTYHYDDINSILFVTFIGGHTYAYENVSKNVFNDLLIPDFDHNNNKMSYGKKFQRVIVKKYNYVELH